VTVDGRLWGLVACHHHSPRVLPGKRRALVGWLAQDLATQIALVEAQAAARRRARLKACRGAQVCVHRDGDGRFCIEVRDAGSGFDTARLTAADSDGTGSGILSMRERPRCLGGRCESESSPGAGTRVVLRAPPDGPERRGAALGAGASAAAGAQGLAEAHPEPQVEALERVHELRPRLVLMDCCMPHMDGLEATRRLKAQHPGLCVIGLSMYQEADRAAAMLSAGAAAYVDKTAGADALLAAIRAQLPLCRIEPGVPPTPSPTGEV